MIEQLRRLFSTATLRESVTYQTLEKMLSYIFNREAVFKGKVDFTGADVTGIGSSSWDDIKDKPASFPPSSHTHPEKQDTLVSGVNIKTVNTQSLLGSGDITIGGGVTSVNTQTGVVVLDADDISDSSTTNKFVTASDLTNLGNLSGVNSGDQDLSGLLPNTHLTDFTHADIAHSNRAALDLVSGTNTGDQSLTGLVPYTGATTNVVLGANTISTTSRVITPKVSPASDSTTAFQVTKADGSTSVVNVDTTNGRVGIGTTAPGKNLDVIGNARFGATGGYGGVVDFVTTASSTTALVGLSHQPNAAWAINMGAEATPNLYIGLSAAFGSATDGYFWRANWNTSGVAVNTFRHAAAGSGLTTVNILAKSSQTGDLLAISSVSGSMGDLVKVQLGGNVGINTITPSAKLHVVGTLLNQKLVEANTAGSGSPNIITAAESGSVFTNEGATALNYHTLPTAASGLVYAFYVQDTDGIRVVANTGDTIRINTSVSASAGYAESTTVGSSVTLAAINATEWVATSVIGTWALT